MVDLRYRAYKQLNLPSPPASASSGQYLIVPEAAWRGHQGYTWDTVTIDNQTSQNSNLYDLFREPGDGKRDPVRLAIWIDGKLYEIEEYRQRSLFPGTVSWFGLNNGLESVVMTRSGKHVSGLISLTSATYSVEFDGADITWTVPDDSEPSNKERNAGSGLKLQGVAPEARVASMRAAPVDIYGSADNLIDVLAVYDLGDLGNPDLDRLHGNVVNGIAVADQAFELSGVNGNVRLVGIEPLDWNTQGPETCHAMRELQNTTDGIASDVQAMRDRFGADIVLGVTAVLENGSGCSSTPSSPSAGTQRLAYVTVQQSALGNSTRHEIGHQLSLRHELHAGSCDRAGSSYACGYTFPHPAEVSDPTTVCPDQGFSTIMGRIRSGNIGGVVFETHRRNFYSSTTRFRATPDCQSSGLSFRLARTGTTIENATGQSSDNARRLRETLPIIEAYRPAMVVVPQDGGSQLTSPQEGSLISGTVTFDWNLVSNTSRYYLEVYDPGTGVEFYSSAISAPPVVVHNLPSNRPVAARLFTDMAVWSLPPQEPNWVWVDYRFNTAGVFSDCNNDELVVGLNSAASTCDGRCTSNGTTISCSSNDGGLDIGSIRAASNLHGAAVHGSYDLAVYGATNSGSAFCCLYHDVGNQITDLRLNGSNRSDIQLLVDGAVQMEEYGQSHLEVEVRGYGRDDLLMGSDETSLAYSEYLRGYNGHDGLYGNAGDDRLGGGYGADFLSGGPGRDVLYSGQDNRVDVLRGNVGSNTLCANKPQDELVGADNYDPNSSAVLYVSSGSSQSMNVNTAANTPWSSCGHVQYGSSWGGCTLYNRSSAPPSCTAMGLGN